MGEIQVSAEGIVMAPAEDVYRYLADYREHHPRFLPAAFSAFQVESGGIGAGTVVRFRMAVGGSSREYRQRVSEPEPGRVLVETGMESGEVTTFTVTPEGTASRVRIDTRFADSGGVRGLVERLVAPRLLRRLYADELGRLDRYARAQASGDFTPSTGESRRTAGM